jgi:hypothetical protein
VTRYRWAQWGDVNAFFGLMLDNVAALVLMLSLLVGLGFPVDLVLGRMLPGTAAGVLFGDLVYTWLATLTLPSPSGRGVGVRGVYRPRRRDRHAPGA